MKASSLTSRDLRKFLKIATEFYKDPANMKDYEAWLEERRKRKAAEAAEQEAAS